MLAHRSSYLRTAAVRGPSKEVVTCEDTVCFAPSLLARALVRVPLGIVHGNAKLVTVCSLQSVSVLCLVYTFVCTVRAQACADEPFFNRTVELECLKRLLFSPPSRSCITVVVGPISSGKTALLKHFISELSREPKQRESQQAPSLEQPLYINSRLEEVSTPDSFAITLLYTIVSAGQQRKGAAAALAMAVLSGLSSKVEHGNETVELELWCVDELFDKLMAAPGSPVGSVLSTVYQALQQTFQGRPRPAIIIDEANKLMSWSATHPEELGTLLSFFVAVTKEQDATHVLLVTSDYSFVSWLKEGEHTAFLGPVAAGRWCLDALTWRLP